MLNNLHRFWKTSSKLGKTFAILQKAAARGEIHEKETGEARLSKQIYNLRQRQKRAQWVADWVAKDWSNWFQLSQADQTLCIQHNDGTIQRQIVDLQARQQPRFPGAGEQLAASAHFHQHIWGITNPSSAERPAKSPRSEWREARCACVLLWPRDQRNAFDTHLRGGCHLMATFSFVNVILNVG